MVKEVLAAFPAEAQYVVTGMSERALAYGQRSLSHVMMVIYEAAGLTSDFGTYLLRSLLTEGRVAYETVEKTEWGLQARLIERQGPTALILTTTELKLHPENETRMLSVPVTDTPDQTRAVMLALAHRSGAQPDLVPWQAFQSWLASKPAVVRIPFATTLAGLIAPVAVRLRRDFGKVLSLIQAHALLHQAVRDHDADGTIVATVDDYSAVHALVADMISEGIESTVPRSVRETVEAVNDLVQHGDTSGPLEDPGVTAAAIGRYLDLDKSAARRRALDAVERGYLQNLEARPHRPGRFVPGEPLPNDVALLPDADDLARAWGGGEVAQAPERPDIPPA
jgi:hypothetical protein